VDPAAQRALLDAFAETEAARARVARAVVRRRACAAHLAALQGEAEAAGARVAEWRVLVREVDELRLRPGDDERLDADIRRLAHAEELQGAVQQAVAALAADERGALARLGVVRRMLAQVARIDDEAGRWEPLLEGARLALDELARELESYAEGVEADPSRLRALEARRETLLAPWPLVGGAAGGRGRGARRLGPVWPGGLGAGRGGPGGGGGGGRGARGCGGTHGAAHRGRRAFG
jgi:DNA repair protein RecN (Recombination protein N)